MRRLGLVALVAVVSTAWAEDAPSPAPSAVVAWFTDDAIEGALRTPPPEDALPAGEEGGVRLVRAVAIPHPLLARESGSIGFWIRPAWDGNDGRRHRVLRIGDPERNGLLVEKSAANVLRFVMASPAKTTSARADASSWVAGRWHHVVVMWLTHEGRALGTAMYLDRVAVAGPVAGGNVFLDPATIPEPRLVLGDGSAEADVAGLVLRRDLSEGPVPLVYRDSFRTAPYAWIAVEPEPMRVRADRRALVGHDRPLGLRAGRGAWSEPITDHAVRYGQWAEFDAKPYVRWSTSDPRVATVDAQGRVHGVAPGTVTVTAAFRGMKATHATTVIPAEGPDLDLVLVERLPRHSIDAPKDRPAPGDACRAVAHVENFGTRAAPAGVRVALDLVPDVNRNGRLDVEETPVARLQAPIEKALAPREATTVDLPFTFPPAPCFVRVRVDPEDAVAEICEANNERCARTDARTARWGFRPGEVDTAWRDRRLNHVGSFSFYDWIEAECERMNVMLRESAFPTTTPQGIPEEWRTDQFVPLSLVGRWEDEEYERVRSLYDGGFVLNEGLDYMSIDPAVIHEMGHCCLLLPDLYGQPIAASSVLLEDRAGKPYAGTPCLPCIDRDLIPFSPAFDVPIGVGYRSLMVDCHLWLHPAHAGQVLYYRGVRKRPFWSAQGALVPAEQVLRVLDVEDVPLAGAAVYAYPACDAGTACGLDWYFADRPKFRGLTDAAGEYTFPRKTDAHWDDPGTDAVDGAVEVWNPFGRPRGARPGDTGVSATSHAFGAEGQMLVKIVADAETEFAWLTQTDLNEAFFRGERDRGVVVLRTSLRRPPSVTALERSRGPRRRVDLAPILDVPGLVRARAGAPFEIDASASRDPEGEPLLLRWRTPGREGLPGLTVGPVLRAVAPTKVETYEIRVSALDGVRATAKEVLLRVRPAEDRVLLEAGETGDAVWRYATQDPGVRFMERRFADTSWRTGEAPFGWGDPPRSFTRTRWTEPDLWLRRTFRLDAAPSDPIRIYAYHDDDMEVWLNGVLAASLQGHTTDYALFDVSPEARAALREGANVIAVHARNIGGAAFMDVGLVR